MDWCRYISARAEIGYDHQIPDSHKHKLDSVGVVISTCLKQQYEQQVPAASKQVYWSILTEAATSILADRNQDLPPHCFLVVTVSLLLLLVQVFVFIWSLGCKSPWWFLTRTVHKPQTSRPLVCISFTLCQFLVVVSIRSWLQMPLLVSTKNLPLTAPS